MSVLLIDAGNSRLKWRWQGDSQQCDIADFAAQPWPDASHVLMASVRELPELEAELGARYASLHVIHRALPQFPDFVHCYEKPERLGVDRWLAMLGAARALPTASQWLVIDAGTALTADLLTRHNNELHHQGGYIVPGLQLAQQALFQRTERVREFADEAPATDFSLANDTLGCVSAGVRRQHVALVAQLCQQYSHASCVITGGDGAWLADAAGCRYHADLVFEGMEELCAGSFFS